MHGIYHTVDHGKASVKMDVLQTCSTLDSMCNVSFHEHCVMLIYENYAGNNFPGPLLQIYSKAFFSPNFAMSNFVTPGTESDVLEYLYLA